MAEWTQAEAGSEISDVNFHVEYIRNIKKGTFYISRTFAIDPGVGISGVYVPGKIPCSHPEDQVTPVLETVTFFLNVVKS